jgi:hypothetical protein
MRLVEVLDVIGVPLLQYINYFQSSSVDRGGRTYECNDNICDSSLSTRVYYEPCIGGEGC